MYKENRIVLFVVGVVKVSVFHSFHGDQSDSKQSGMKKVWNIFSGRLSGAPESEWDVATLYVYSRCLYLLNQVIYKKLSIIKR